MKIYAKIGRPSSRKKNPGKTERDFRCYRCGVACANNEARSVHEMYCKGINPYSQTVSTIVEWN